jgi:hypothetical protein
MALFSERKEYKTVENTLNVECMDINLRNSLWNIIMISPLRGIGENTFYKYCPENIQVLIHILYRDYWKLPLDELRGLVFSPYTKIKSYFFDCRWCEVYDFLEILVEECYYMDVEKFIEDCNIILEKEHSGYRFVDGIISEITSEIEIKEIEEALNNSQDIIQVHLQKALELLSDKESPDYRNSIKESISAVESICKLIVKDEKTTLGRALNAMENKNILELHPSLKDAFKNLYTYTNDADGIRHALKEESKLDFEDAKFMLVACSAFVNYLLVKWNK